MKALTFPLLAATLNLLVVSGHYYFETIITGTTKTASATRIPVTDDPLMDVLSTDIRCNINNGPANLTLDIEAGSDISWELNTFSIYHQGPAMMYLGRVPEGQTATTWDGSGANWFKIRHWSGVPEAPPEYAEWGPWWEFEATRHKILNFTIPAAVPSGEYLLRSEQIGLHVLNHPQYYVSCAQIRVVNGGNGKPPMVEIPGHIQPDDPWLHIDINHPIAGSVYEVPGPDVWTGEAS